MAIQESHRPSNSLEESVREATRYPAIPSALSPSDMCRCALHCVVQRLYPRDVRGRFGTVVWWVAAAAVLWLARQLIGLSDPAYYDPVTVLDYAAAWMTSIAGVATAVALVMWWRISPVRWGRWIFLVAAAAFFLSAVGNVLGDVYDLEIGEALWTAGGLAVVTTVAAGLITLIWSSSARLSGLFLVVFAVSLGLPDVGGLWLAVASLLVVAYLLARQQNEPANA